MSAPRALLAAALILAVTALAALPAAAGARTKWLCRPGLADNPCVTRLDTTSFSPDGGVELGTERIRPLRRRLVDCFYVYPTVSDQPTVNADRTIDPELRSAALYEAARFSRVCRVFAPVYRQLTLVGLTHETPAASALAYRDVRTAFRDYMRRYNHGRGVVLIGHSQGTYILRRLVAEQIDDSRRARRRLVSALLLGGDVTVKEGRRIGGDFQHVPGCRSAVQLGCVVAYSTFGTTPPANSMFGRTDVAGREVLCTNPARLGLGDEGLLDPVVPSTPFAAGTTIGAGISAVGYPAPPSRTPWFTLPDSYSARCVRANGARVLQVTPQDGALVLNAVPPTYGLHLADLNIALGNLTRLVRRQAAAYALRAEG